MIYLSKHSFIYSLIFFVIITSCKKKAQDIIHTPALSFVESTIPKNDLAAEGGTVSIDVKWAYTRWSIKTEAETGESIVFSEIIPAYAGADDMEGATNKVKITYKSNDSYEAKRIKLIVKSIKGDLSQTIVLQQAARVVVPINISLNEAKTYQTISGFGGANTIWGTDFLTPSEIKSVFGTGENELGLSIMRVRLSSTQADWSKAVPTLQEAKKYNVAILASPWSPPANLKDNNNIVDGSLLTSNYASYAKYMNDFVKYMNTNGVTIDAVSIQNEPDWHASYEGCVWSPDQIFHFIKDNGAAIKADVPGTKIAAAESLNSNQAYTSKILNDNVAVNNLDIIAGHLYGGGLTAYPLAEQKGKEIWMTEYLLNQNSGADPANWKETDNAIWDESLQMLESIHTSMTLNWNAYIWWYIRRFYSFLGDGEHGTSRNTILKRGYAFSQFAKFVRPGYKRIDTQIDDSSSKLKITAYKGDHKIVVVIINSENQPVYGVNFLRSENITSAVSYTSSVQKNGFKETLVYSGKKVSLNMQAKSVVTLILQ